MPYSTKKFKNLEEKKKKVWFRLVWC